MCQPHWNYCPCCGKKIDAAPPSYPVYPTWWPNPTWYYPVPTVWCGTGSAPVSVSIGGDGKPHDASGTQDTSSPITYTYTVHKNGSVGTNEC